MKMDGRERLVCMCLVFGVSAGLAYVGPLSKCWSSVWSSVLAKKTRDGARRLSGIPASETADPPRKRLRSALPVVNHFAETGGDAKLVEDGCSSGVPAAAAVNDDGHFQLASAGPESLLFSFPPFGAASDTVVGPSGSVHGVQPKSLFKLDGVKHKIFLSHAGAQKNFVDQLCVDLEHKGYLFPFFDQRQHSLPKGEDFGPLIIEAARLCRVAVIVLSEEYLSSKWPMIELAEFYGAQQGVRGGVGKCKLLPLFFKLSIKEVKDEVRWMSKWEAHAACDDRIDLSQWRAAMRALCKSNGLDFEKFGRKEVAYRKCVVESIFKLSPPNSLFGSFERMVGCGRMCEAMSTQFVMNTAVGAQVLGVYGMAGLGKTMLAKALHDHFYEEYLGKVCYVDMRVGSRVGRQERILKMLCGFEGDEVAHSSVDFEKGLMQMKAFMECNRIFLVLDNITNDAFLLEEVEDYLRVGFHPQSRIMITSSSKAILEDLLPEMKSYMPMPTLTIEEASALFLQHASPLKAFLELTMQEQSILEICINKCWFASEEGGFYHPMTLIAFADFLWKLGKRKGNQLLDWKDHLEKEMDLVEDVLMKDLFGILNLQFNSFDFSAKLLFLDMALYIPYFYTGWGEDGDYIDWLCRLHRKSPTFMKGKLLDLRKSGMINFDILDDMDFEVWCAFNVPDLYKEFAKWYATNHNIYGVKDVWGVFHPQGMIMGGDSATPRKIWSNLIRLRIFDMSLMNAQPFASKKLRGLSNLVVLHLSHCCYLTTLNLEGLHCLCDLQLEHLWNLKTITLCGNSSKDEYVDIYNSLQYVRFVGLLSLVDMPDLRPCTSLHSFAMSECEELGSLEGADCPCLKALRLHYLSPIHFESLLNFKCIQSLEFLGIHVDGDVRFDVEWKQKKDEKDAGLEATLEGEGPCAKFLEELCSLLNRSNSMICTDFSVLKKVRSVLQSRQEEVDYEEDSLHGDRKGRIQSRS